jgi:hypothetical protein
MADGQSHGSRQGADLSHHDQKGTVVLRRPLSGLLSFRSFACTSQPAVLNLSDNSVAFVRRLADVKDELAKIGQK